MESLLFHAVTGIIAASIFLLLARWILGISSIMEYQKIQCRLLAKIAKQSGVHPDEVDNIMNH